MESWQPVSDREFAFFFEDDIQVSPLYFDYSLAALHKYIIPEGRRAPATLWTERLVGISLNTPRYDEINMPARDWIPQQEIGEGEALFLFQLPCSWGALYFPWLWRDFLDYYRWRRDNTPQELHASIPDSATMHWRQSWKKYLIEFMYMRGQVMLYPSLPRQQSFSTHHREPGEHTDAKPQEHLVEELGTLILDYFTVPLLKADDQAPFERLLAEMKPLRELPLVSFHHERVGDLYALTQLGLFTTVLMTRAGWNHSKYLQNPHCLLDSVTFPLQLARPPEGQAEEWQDRYLLYEPQTSLPYQLNALKNAAAYAKILNRTLIVPPIVAARNYSVQIPITRFVDLGEEQLAGKDDFLPMIRLEDFVKTHHGWIERIVQLVPWTLRKSALMRDMSDEGIVGRGLIPAQQAILHVFPTRQKDIVASFGGCQDQVLAFRHMLGSFSNFTDAVLGAEFAQWARSALRLPPPVTKFIARAQEEIAQGDPVACVVYSRGEVPEECGRPLASSLKLTADQQKLVTFRSCYPTLDRTLEYAIEDASTLNITLGSLYVLGEMALPTEWATLRQGARTLRISTRATIQSLIRGAVEVSDLPSEIQEELAEVVEGELCAKAAFFLGNYYSARSNRLMLRRPPHLPSNYLGLKVKPTIPVSSPLTNSSD